jgi:hypothetical protein
MIEPRREFLTMTSYDFGTPMNAHIHEFDVLCLTSRWDKSTTSQQLDSNGNVPRTWIVCCSEYLVASPGRGVGVRVILKRISFVFPYAAFLYSTAFCLFLFGYIPLCNVCRLLLFLYSKPLFLMSPSNMEVAFSPDIFFSSHLGMRYWNGLHRLGTLACGT